MNSQGDLQAEEEKAKEQEESGDKDNLLTFELSEFDDSDNKQKQPDAPIDEMQIANQIKTQYIKRTFRLLRFLQLLTEGHNLDLQNFLREQKYANGIVNPKSFDFISYVAQMLAIYEKQYINCFSCELGMQIIDTLIEVIQGPCKLN